MNQNEGHIIKTMMLGNTKIVICDDYAAKTNIERENVLRDFKELLYSIANNQFQRTKDKQ